MSLLSLENYSILFDLLGGRDKFIRSCEANFAKNRYNFVQYLRIFPLFLFAF